MALATLDTQGRRLESFKSHGAAAFLYAFEIGKNIGGETWLKAKGNGIK